MHSAVLWSLLAAAPKVSIPERVKLNDPARICCSFLLALHSSTSQLYIVGLQTSKADRSVHEWPSAGLLKVHIPGAPS